MKLNGAMNHIIQTTPPERLAAQVMIKKMTISQTYAFEPNEL
jgi:hypothetical protein